MLLIFEKIKKNKILNDLYKINMFKNFYRALGYTIHKIMLVVPFIRFLFSEIRDDKKQILAVWDFQVSVYTIGDLLTHSEAANVARLIHKANKIDFCFIINPLKPQRGDFDAVNPDNYHYYLQQFIPVVYANQNLGSIFIFASHKQFEKFIVDNADQYYIWPPVDAYLRKKHAYKLNFDFIQDFYRKNKFIPYLSCKPITLKWAHKFIMKNIWPAYPIVVHLRRDPLRAQIRNAKTEEWIKFFNSCINKHPSIKFVLIGRKDEIDERVRALPNIICSKDFNTSIEQDLALIQTALMYLGSASGPASMAVFSDLPYVVFGVSAVWETIEKDSDFIFSSNLQKLIWKPETNSLIGKEFEDLLAKIDKGRWEEKYKKADKEYHINYVPYLTKK